MDLIKKILKYFIPIKILRKGRKALYQVHINCVGKIKKITHDGSYPEGCNIVGSIYLQTGLGESVRQVIRAVDLADIKCSLIDFSLIKKRDELEFQNRVFQKFVYDINIIDVNMHEFAYFVNAGNKKNLDKRYNILYWVWEMERFPKEWLPMLSVADEIWTPSHFSANTFRKVFEKSVYVVPHYIEVEVNREFDRGSFGLPNHQFLILMLFDFHSLMDRKNPYAVIEAFKRAFSKEQDVALVIKINQIPEKERSRIESALQGYQYYFIEEMMPREKLNRLIELMDVFISLHRAEGFGLVLAEAMALGTPTVSTKYSGNLDFQNEENSCLVDAEQIELETDILPYHKGDVWAEPNVDMAATYLSQLYKDREYRDRISSNAKCHIRQNYNKEAVSKVIKKRYEEIRKEMQ